MEDENANVRVEKIKDWLKNKHNFIFVLILILGIAIRLYYFSITKSQPLWWDEADYLAYAKNLAGFPVSWIATPEHNSLYSFLVALIFKIGFSEPMVKFLLQVVPSVLSIVLVYAISNQMYKDIRIGLIASFIMVVFWAHLFNTMRFHVDVPGLFTGLLAIYVFWQGYENKQKIFGKINPNWAIPLTVFLAILTYTIRRGYFLFGLFFLVYMFSTRKVKNIVKDKYNWVGLVLALVLFFVAEQFIFISKIEEVSQGYFHPENKINLITLDVFPSYFNSLGSIPSVLLYLFWIGFAIMIVRLVLSYRHIRNSGGSTKADLFNVLSIILTLAFFIYVLRIPNVFGEDRWFFPLAFASFVAIAKATIVISEYSGKYNKHLKVVLLVVLIGAGGYYEIQHGDLVIRGKAGSYEGIREASLTLKEISNPGDKIITLGQPQVEYYSERSTIHAREWVDEDPKSQQHLEAMLEKIEQTPEARYILISFNENRVSSYPVWMAVEQTQGGQTTLWVIPFMDSVINFQTGQQNILQEKQFGDLTFKLVDVKQDVFVYEIIRN